MQYREYVRRLERVGQDLANKELSDIDLLELFRKPKTRICTKILRGVMSTIVRAALLISIESVVETWISTMEHHASQRRTLGEMLLHEEMVIAINGPSPIHCDSIVLVTEVFGIFSSFA